MKFLWVSSRSLTQCIYSLQLKQTNCSPAEFRVKVTAGLLSISQWGWRYAKGLETEVKKLLWLNLNSTFLRPFFGGGWA